MSMLARMLSGKKAGAAGQRKAIAADAASAYPAKAINSLRTSKGDSESPFRSQNILPVQAMPSAPAIRPAAAAGTLSRRAEDFPIQERKLRDEKLDYIRAVWTLHRQARISERAACVRIAEERSADYPMLSVGGKNGTSALRYNNYRNWVTGTGRNGKAGLGRLNDGTPDFRNADRLLRDWVGGRKQELAGDPCFWTALKAIWLRTSGQKLAKSYRMLAWQWAVENPDQQLPTLNQVRFHFQKAFPLRMQILARKGETAWEQHVRDSIERDPASLQPGEAWVADTKDCDFMIRVPDDDPKAKSPWKVIRPKIVCIMDVKSQFPVSVQLIDGNCNNAIIRNGFAAAVYRFGRPKIFLTDNGSDYCAVGFGKPVVFTPSVDSSKVYEHSILKELNVEHDTALPYNARAKIVERFFRTVAEYERDSRGYVGNMPEHRPAEADVWAKIKGREYLNNTEEACQWLAKLIMLYLNTPSNGRFLNGLTPMQAFRPELRHTQPPLSDEEYLRAFRMPLQDSKRLDLRGPSVRLKNIRYVVRPEDREASWAYDRQLVMIKTVQFDDSKIWIYTLDGKYIAECHKTQALPYFDAPKELLAQHQEDINSERVTLRARLMDETGGWHLIDAQTTYQQSRQAFLDKAPTKKLDTMHSVKGETHNPRIYITKGEEHAPTVLPGGDSESPRQLKEKGDSESPVAAAIGKGDNTAMQSLVIQAITGGFGQDQEDTAAYALPKIKEKNSDEKYHLPVIE